MATAWRINLLEDTNLNDSDKIFTVPENTEWELLWIWVEYISTATVGDRQLEIQLQSSGSNIIAQWQPGTIQSESLTYNYLFGTGDPDLESPRDTSYLMTPMFGAAFLSAGQKIRIWDNNGVDAAADDMTVKIQYGYHEI